jgi:hypothetical protein
VDECASVWPGCRPTGALADAPQALPVGLHMKAPHPPLSPEERGEGEGAILLSVMTLNAFVLESFGFGKIAISYLTIQNRFNITHTDRILPAI